MEIKFYKFKKRVNSTKRPGQNDQVVFDCTDVRLKNATSIINPVFIIEGSGDGYMALTIPMLDANYCYVPDFNRYYFIDDVTLIANNVVQISCSVDALASNRTEILNSSQYVLRSASQYDGNIVDNYYLTKADYLTCKDILPFDGDNIFWCPPGTGSVNDFHYVVATVGSFYNASALATVQGVNYYALTVQQMTDFVHFLSQAVENYLDIPETVMNGDLLKSLYDPFQYVKSVMYFPFGLGNIWGADQSPIEFGYWQGSYGHRITNTQISGDTRIVFNKHPLASTRGAYMNIAPYSEYTLHCEPFGTIPLDATLLQDAEMLKLHVQADVTTGESKLIIKAVDLEHQNEAWGSPYMKARPTIATAYAKLGVDVPVASIQTDYVNMGQSMLGAMNSGLGLVASAMSENVVGLASSTTGIASGLGDFVRSCMPVARQSGASGSYLSCTDIYSLKLTEKHVNVVGEDLADFGRPLCQTKVLSSLSGYVLCKDVELALSTTKSESEKCISYLESGAFIE